MIYLASLAVIALLFIGAAMLDRSDKQFEASVNAINKTIRGIHENENPEI